MITVEELIVHSLYHRLVLITIRRTPNTNAGEGQEKVKGENVGAATVVSNGSGPTTSQGLGYLYLGSLGSVPAIGNHQPGERVADTKSTDACLLERRSEPTATITLEENPQDSAVALVRSLWAERDIAVCSRVCTVLDTSDMNAIQRLLRSAEVQTDFEPMWCVGQNLFPDSAAERSVEMLTGPLSTLNASGSGPLLDLRNCNQFSVMRFEDLQDPTSQSLVMVNTNEIVPNGEKKSSKYEENGELSNATVEKQNNGVVSATPMHKFCAKSEKVSSQGALFVEDSSGHLKREILLGSAVTSRATGKSQEVDSGIWDMMQTLDSSGNTQILSDYDSSRAGLREDLVQKQISSPERHSVSSNDLKGTYKMFQFSDQLLDASLSTSKESCLDSLQEDRSLKVHESDNGSCEGGLSDALKPATAVNFIIHRVETEMVRLEAVEDGQSLDKSTKKERIPKRRDRAGSARTSDRRRTKSVKTRRMPKVASQSCHKCRTKAKEGQKYRQEVESPETDSGDRHGTNDEALLRLRTDIRSLTEPRGDLCSCCEAMRQRGPRFDDEDLEPEQELYEDVIKVTSLKIDRSVISTGSSENLTEIGCQAQPWEIVVPPRKSQSERSSPLSSLADIRSWSHKNTKHNLEKKRFLAHSANVSPTRKSLPLSSPVYGVASCQFPTAETPGTPWTSDLPCITPGARGSVGWGSDHWSAGTTDSLSTMNIMCEPEQLQFEKFPDWMKKLRVELHTVPLSEVCIPGSHIALAIERDMKTDWDFSRCNYEMAEFLRKLPNLPVFNNFRDHMKSIWKAWMPKQWLSVHDQLVAGSRYLDLRVTKNDDIIYGEHGLYTRQLKKYLKEIRLFMEEQPFEVIILHFQSCDYLDRADKRHLVTMLFQIFGAKMACKAEGSTLPTLQWMWSMKKQLLILFPEKDIELIKNHIFGGLVWSDELVEVTTPKKQTVAQLVDYLEESVRTRLTARETSKLFVCKAVLSPDMSTVFGKFQHHCMRDLVSCEISSAVNLWLKGKTQLNIVAIDFVGVGGTVEKILELNMCQALEN